MLINRARLSQGSPDQVFSQEHVIPQDPHTHVDAGGGAALGLLSSQAHNSLPNDVLPKKLALSLGINRREVLQLHDDV
jgi:hypothetical protein